MSDDQESQAEAIIRARRRRKTREEPEVVVVREVDESDSIVVLGHSRTLMHLVRTFGLKRCNKNIKDLSRGLNLIVDLQDNDYMKLLNVNKEAIKDLKK
ncbi:hypothetical protein INT46_007812 [Mucor plumbeus]|uniref:Uncharacterized protein n=1 Tax=Mucor plumbeus TaxID=97098 RepID=A0A8H7UUJ9_9FUNG|nr:hypothetical protein INT46_007812 [Mucor plumbeus]